MRILAIGDIHGCLRALITLLKAVQPRPEDLIITLGDYVDRGPDSFGVIEHLLALRQTHQLIALRGNHEEMMMAARDVPKSLPNWLMCGGRQALASYATDGGPGSVDDIPESHWDFLENGCRDWHETATHLFAHGAVYPDLAMREQPGYILRWETVYSTVAHCSGKTLICGHTQQRNGLPLDLGHAICIDTWAYGKGWLTCLDVINRHVWQAKESGSQREFRLAERSEPSSNQEASGEPQPPDGPAQSEG
jgi:serine/threonine protein phosphatase 1